MFETFSHTADLGLRVRADSLEDLLAEAGRGLCAVLVANLDEVRTVEEVAVEIDEDDVEYLLFDWLNELLYYFDTDHLLLVEFDIHLDGGKLTARCRGEKMDLARHQMDHEVKAITYHGLKVEQTTNGWLAEVIVDI